MRGRWEVVLLVAVLGAVVACTGTGHPAGAGQRASMTPLPGHRVANGEPGAPGCHPASPVSRFGSFLPQVEGTGRGVTLWGLLMFPHLLPARVGDQEKIVWRMTGVGLLTLTAIGPNGAVHRPAWGPAPHTSSTWHKPGAEWGAGYVFTAPGCWDLRAARGQATADVWIHVVR